MARVEKALRKVPGVASATVNLATERATVILDRVQDAGNVVPIDSTDDVLRDEIAVRWQTDTIKR